MLSKDAWRRRSTQRLLVATGLAAIVGLASCHRFDNAVYIPAPTPIFMEEGLRSAEPRSPTLETADARRDQTWEPGQRPTELPPPTQPPPTQPPPTQPPTNGQSSAPPPPGPAPVNPYEALPLVAGTTNGVTLAQAIDETLNASVAVREQVENVVQSQADVRTATLIPNPQLMMLSSLLPYPGHPFNKFRQGGPPQYDIWAVWPIDWYLFGKRNAEIEAAARQVDVAAAEFADFARQRIAQAVATYFAVLEAKALLQMAIENTQNLERVVEHTQLRFANEAAARIDVERAQIQYSNARRDIRTGESTLAAAKAQLRALMGRQGLDPTFDVAGALSVSRPVPPPPIEFALSIADQWRPDVIAAVRKIEQAQAQIAVEDLKRFPAVGVQTGWTYQDQRQAIGFPGEPSWNMGVTGPLPLFDRNQGNRWKARSQLAQAQIALDVRRIQVQSEVEQAIASYDATYRIVTSEAPRQLEMARSVMNRIEEAYREGGRTLIDLLESQRAYRDTYRLQINAEVGYWRAIYQLNAVVGQQIVP
jgi:cobalt-zinc-cadmium efflux system outer membrane protein